MCGIAGYVLNQAAPADPAMLRSMASRLAHRGPDGEGIYTNRTVGLAHRRLAIIDLTEGGVQPLIDADLAISYNGEVYNFRELKAELEQLGHRFRTQSDVEVVLLAYRQWGADCVTRFRGMWALAIWDTTRNVLFCARDPFGIKPFYYASIADRFVFASEPGALLAAGVQPKADLEIVASFLVLGLSDHSTRSFYADICALGAGGRMEVRAGGRVVQLPAADPLATERVPSSAEEFEATLRTSIRFHLRSDVPVGTCLSGGLDSSVVAAIASSVARADGAERFSAVTAGVDDPAMDERRFATQVAQQCGLDWHTTCPSMEDFTANLHDFLDAQGEPVLSPSVYLQYAVMRKAHSIGLKVLLDGQGADELLCGYERYIGPLYRALRAERGSAAAAREALGFARASRGGASRALATSLYFSIPWLRHRTTGRRAATLIPALRAPIVDAVGAIGRSFRGLRTARLEEIRRYSLPALLRFEDRNSMRFSVEARVPYVDAEVVRCALALPANDLLRDGYSKRALREIGAKLLPPAVAWRKYKIGFEAPINRWLDGMRGEIDSSIRSSGVLASAYGRPATPDPGSDDLRWRQYCVSRWEAVHGVFA